PRRCGLAFRSRATFQGTQLLRRTPLNPEPLVHCFPPPGSFFAKQIRFPVLHNLILS
ncbi:hypothetical protein VDGL01_05626, partial [Verticillium dahliae]